MQCTASSPGLSRSCAAPAPAIPSEAARQEPLVVSAQDLLTAFAQVADPRRRQGTRFPLPAILALAVAAILSNHLSVLAIAEWGAAQRQELRRRLGFPQGRTPHQSTLQRVFSKLDPAAVSAVLTAAFAAPAGPAARPRGSEGVAIDGKAQRGRLAHDPTVGPVQALSAFCHERGVVLAQVPITVDAATDKAEAELTVAPTLLRQIDWSGRVLTGDALFCQRQLCQQVVAAGGDYLLLVKENQPTLHEDIRLLFDPAPDDLDGLPPWPLTDCRETQTHEQGHGRSHEVRHLRASTDLVGYSDWPALAQVFRLERTWWEHGKANRIVQYGITSLPPAVADAPRLLALKRGHWQIENALHYVKDVTLGEDRSLIHAGHGPSILALLRNCSLSLLRHHGCRTIAQRLRYHSSHPEEAVALVTSIPTQNA